MAVDIMEIHTGVEKGKEKGFQTVWKAQKRMKNLKFVVIQMCVELWEV